LQQSHSESHLDLVPHRQYLFADFLLDRSRGALLRDGEEIPLRKQAFEMLLLLVEHPGELVSKDSLMDNIWRDAVVTENSINQCLKEIRHAIGDHDRSIIRTVPRRGLIFESPVERIAPVAGSKRGTDTSQRRWLIGAAVAASFAAALVWWVLDNSKPEEGSVRVDTTPPPAHSLAVLPFVNMSPDPEVSYLADGISEEILNQLAQIPNLLVIARTSSFTFRDPDFDIVTIGQQLNVAHVLEGSVRIDDNMARVTAQLVRTDDQTHLWSQSYDRPLDNIFELQTGIAEDVAEQLHVKLRDAGEGETQVSHEPNPRAYEAYLRGQYLMAQRTEESMAGALDEFTKAVELDPDYAPAQAGLALATRFQSETQYGLLPNDEALARARPHAERALALDPGLAEGHAAMAYVLATTPTLDQAIFHFRWAVALNPNYADGANWLSGLLHWKGEYEESFELLQRAVRSDPLAISATGNYAFALLERGRFEEARNVLQKLASLAPAHYRARSIQMKFHRGWWAEAALAALAAEFEEIANPRLNRNFAFYLATMGMGQNALALADPEQARVLELLGRPKARLREFEQGKPRGFWQFDHEWRIGEALAATGEFERALPYLEDHWAYMDGVVNYNMFGAREVLALIRARRATSKETGSEALVTALQESVQRFRNADIVKCEVGDCVDFEAGIAAYLTGDRQSAVNLLTSAVDRGHVIPANLTYLRFLYDDAEMTPVFERQRARRFAEQEKFLQAFCSDNSYSDLWQPVEGTCSQL